MPDHEHPVEHQPTARPSRQHKPDEPWDRGPGSSLGDAPGAEPARQVVTSDPARIRALTHPLRLQLLDLLDDHGPSTATQCAALTGESVASCSFHLRTLARHGFIEPAERTGREKPWQVVGHGRRTLWDHEAPGSLRAVTELARITLDREAARTADWLDRASALPPEWLDASTMTVSTFWATADEMAQLTSEIEALTARFAGRSDDPTLRPEGARSAHLWAVAYGEPDPDPVPGSQPEPTPAPTEDSPQQARRRPEDEPRDRPHPVSPQP